MERKIIQLVAQTLWTPLDTTLRKSHAAVPVFATTQVLGRSLTCHGDLLPHPAQFSLVLKGIKSKYSACPRSFTLIYARKRCHETLSVCRLLRTRVEGMLQKATLLYTRLYGPNERQNTKRLKPKGTERECRQTNQLVRPRADLHTGCI